MRPMNDLRTEDELRAALEELSHGAPEIANVLPTTTADTQQRRRRLVRWTPVAAAAAVVAVAAGVVVGLAHNGRSGPPATSANTSDLVGIEWQAQSVDGAPAARGLTLKIEPNGRFWQNIGSCSSLLGQLSITPTELKIDHARLSLGLCPGIPATPSPRQRQQAAALKHMLTGTVSLSIQNGQLTLHKGGVPTIVYARSPHSPAHTRQWTFHGVGISLPASWQANTVRCGAPIANTVIFPGPVSSCTYPRPPGVTSVQFRAYDPTYDPFASPPPGVPGTFLIDGVEATERSTDPREPLQIVEIQLSSRDATVVIASPSRNEAFNLESQLYIAGR